VLRVAAALPVAAILFTVVTHPNVAIGQVLFAGVGPIELAGTAVALLGIRFGAPVTHALHRRFFRAAYDQEGILHRVVEAVKLADTVEDVDMLARREIDAALHVTRVVVMHREPAGTLASEMDSMATGGPKLAHDSPLAAELERTKAARTIDDLRRIG